MAKDTMTQDIQSQLAGLEFPSNKQAIINHAKRKNAPGNLISMLNGIPDKEYMDYADLMKEMDSR